MPLALQGLEAANNSLQQLYESHGEHAGARYNMALASLLSGINLAQTGLGSVHGLASPLGAFFPIPHGICCGVLVSAATKVNIDALQERASDGWALKNMSGSGACLRMITPSHKRRLLPNLQQTLQNWTLELELPRLSDYGVTREDLPPYHQTYQPLQHENQSAGAERELYNQSA